VRFPPVSVVSLCSFLVPPQRPPLRLSPVLNPLAVDVVALSCVLGYTNPIPLSGCSTCPFHLLDSYPQCPPPQLWSARPFDRSQGLAWGCLFSPPPPELVLLLRTRRFPLFCTRTFFSPPPPALMYCLDALFFFCFSLCPKKLVFVRVPHVIVSSLPCMQTNVSFC